MIRPASDAVTCSDCGCELCVCGLAAPEEKKKLDETEGNDESESEDGLSGGDGKAPECGDEG